MSGMVESQKAKTHLEWNYDNFFHLNVTNNGTISNMKGSLDYLEYSLRNLTLYQKKSGQENFTKIEKSFMSFDDKKWILSETKTQIDMKFEKLELNFRIVNSVLEMNVTNKLFIDKEADTEYLFEYGFDYKSFSSYDYTSDVNEIEGKERALFSSGIDRMVFYVNKQRVSIQRNSFIIRQLASNDNGAFRMRHIIPHSTRNENKHLKQDGYTCVVKEYGGETQVIQPQSPNYAQSLYVDIVSAYDLNEKKQFNEENLFAINFDKKDEDQSLKKNSNNIEFDTFTWITNDKETNKTKIKQNVQVITMQHLSKFTNEDSLEDKDAYYNFNNIKGENYLNKGDIIVSYEIENFKFEENAKYFEMPIYLTFTDDSKYKVSKENYINTYANMISENDEGKIVSVKINKNEKSEKFQINYKNYIFVRTTPFKGKATIQLLFKSFIKHVELVDEQPFKSNNEKLVFDEFGGRFVFADPQYDIKYQRSLVNNEFKSLQFDSFIESYKGEVTENHNLKNIYFNLFNADTSTKKYSSKSLDINNKGNVELQIHPSPSNDYSFDHYYINAQGEKKNETITLNDGEIYVSFKLNWLNCIKENGKLNKLCNSKEVDKVSTKIYLNEIIQDYEQKKKSANYTETNLVIEYNKINGNYASDSHIGVDYLPMIAESMITFDFDMTKLNKTNPILNGCFKVKYTFSNPHPFPGFLLFLIIFGCILLVIIAAILIRREINKRGVDSSQFIDSNSQSQV